jgi:3'-phosphoadenosine 5'-phosphosulfate sulfotransferase (PAPS reductase)/FAD synthetase
MKYVAISGGADSTALALLLWERGEEFELVFSDTGAELPEVYWLLPRVAKTIGKKLHVVSNGSFFQHLSAYGFILPGSRMRWCTRLLKLVPQDRFLQTVGAETVYIGIRADEPRRLHTNPRPRIGAREFVYPLAEAGMGKADVKELCAKYNLLCSVYQWRSSVSCFCCFFSKGK